VSRIQTPKMTTTIPPLNRGRSAKPQVRKMAK